MDSQPLVLFAGFAPPENARFGPPLRRAGFRLAIGLRRSAIGLMSIGPLPDVVVTAWRPEVRALSALAAGGVPPVILVADDSPKATVVSLAQFVTVLSRPVRVSTLIRTIRRVLYGATGRPAVGDGSPRDEANRAAEGQLAEVVAREYKEVRALSRVLQEHAQQVRGRAQRSRQQAASACDHSAAVLQARKKGPIHGS
jgi:hypothetical protein